MKKKLSQMRSWNVAKLNKDYSIRVTKSSHAPCGGKWRSVQQQIVNNKFSLVDFVLTRGKTGCLHRPIGEYDDDGIMLSGHGTEANKFLLSIVTTKVQRFGEFLQ